MNLPTLPVELRLEVIEEGTRSELCLARDTVRVGRSVDNELRLASKQISRQHCRFERAGEAWVLVDLGSANGTLLNGRRVERAELADGDEVALGAARLIVHLAAAAPAGAPGALEPVAGIGAVGLSTLAGTGAREREGLRTFARTMRALSSSTELPGLLRLILGSAIELSSAERGFLLLREEGSGAPLPLAVKVALSFDGAEIPSAASRISTGITRSVLESARPVLSVDAGRDDRFGGMISVEDLKLRSVLAVPIRSDGQVQGVLYLDNRLQQGAFSEQELDLVELFADQAALALRLARQIHELREQNRMLSESRVQIERLNEQLGRKVRDRDAELAVVRAELSRERSRYDYTGIVGQSASMRQVFQQLDRIVDSELPVLIRGESGTGKELIARAVHYNGPRKARPFVSESCAALPDSLLESELFGHTRGAFTGADRAKKGLVEQAQGGTLFLDEIGDMSVEMQKKLLRVLQEGEVRPLGSAATVKVDFRLVAASHKDLAELVAAGQFREDLYYRVKVLEIALPPLRERADDIPLLAEALLARAARDAHRPTPILSNETMAALVAHAWPGNVRELENEMRRLAVLAGEVVGPELLSEAVRTQGAARALASGPAALAPGADLRHAVASFEREAIVAALARAGGNKSRAAGELGISRFALQRKLFKYGLASPEDEPLESGADAAVESDEPPLP